MRMRAKKSFGRLRRIIGLSFGCICGGLTANIAMADIVVPNQYASMDAPTSGDSGYAGFDAGSISISGLHYQCFISQSQLSAISTGTQITGISFRLDRESYWSVGSQVPTNGDAVFPEYNVTLSQAATTVSTFSSIFADNLLNPVLVRSGPLTVPQGAFKPNGAPGAGSASLPFYEMIVFSNPYTYLGGDLVVDVGYLGGSEGIGMDGTQNTDSTFPYRFEAGEGANGAVANYGEVSFPVMQLVTVVPSPSSIALVSMSGVGIYRRRRK